MTRGNIAMMSAGALAQALAELAYQVYRGKKPPTSVLKAFGAIVAMATKSGAVVAPKKRTSATRRNGLNGHHVSNGPASAD